MYKQIRRRDRITPADDARANAVIDAAVEQYQLSLLFGGKPAKVVPPAMTDIHYAKIISEARMSNYVPFIRLRGKWLMRAGFESGNQISIEIGEPGTLIIRKVEAGA